MAEAIWNNTVVAESETFEVVEGNIYFPRDAIRSDFFVASDTTSYCPWKGTAHYYSVSAEGEMNRDAAWYYPDPKPAADNIKDHIAFWRGVRVEK